MKQLSHESRALLAEARRSEHLSPGDKARIRSKLAQRISAGLALGSALTATATVAEAAHTGALASVVTWLPGVAKVLSVVAITGAVSVGVVKATRTTARATPAPVAARVIPVTQMQPRQYPGIAVTSASAEAPAETVTAIRSTEPLPSVQRASGTKRTVPNPVAPSDRVPPPAARAVSDGLAGQVIAIRTARAAIRDGDPQAALTILDRDMPEAQTMALSPEAALARVAAYCRLGQTEAARRTAERFSLQYPNSPLTARMRESCAGATRNQP